MKKLVLLFILFSVMFSYSQEDNDVDYSKFGYAFSPGLFIQKDIFAEVNVMIGEIYTESPKKLPPMIGVRGFRIGLETNFKSGNDFVIAPKIGYDISITFFTIRLSALNYFKDGASEFRLLPEVGMSIGGSLNLTYGYGITIGNSVSGIAHHRVGLSFNINRSLNRATLSRL